MKKVQRSFKKLSPRIMCNWYACLNNMTELMEENIQAKKNLALSTVRFFCAEPKAAIDAFGQREGGGRFQVSIAAPAFFCTHFMQRRGARPRANIRGFMLTPTKWATQSLSRRGDHRRVARTGLHFISPTILSQPHRQADSAAR
ncbi:MAG: hypothetical protein HY231_05605 [Acidobacteria bacterium]|nr:hypothetical protein [Acidobacteriota bacterium]